MNQLNFTFSDLIAGYVTRSTRTAQTFDLR